MWRKLCPQNIFHFLLSSTDIKWVPAVQQPSCLSWQFFNTYCSPFLSVNSTFCMSSSSSWHASASIGFPGVFRRKEQFLHCPPSPHTSPRWTHAFQQDPGWPRKRELIGSEAGNCKDIIFPRMSQQMFTNWVIYSRNLLTETKNENYFVGRIWSIWVFSGRLYSVSLPW